LAVLWAVPESSCFRSLDMLKATKTYHRGRAFVSIFLVFSIIISSSLTRAQGKPNEDKRIKQLANEKRKLAGTTKAESRAKSLMRIAEITLSYVGEAASAKDIPKMQVCVEQYRQAITDARDAMMKSGLDPQKKSGEYMAVEIGLRKQIRVL